jgi:hypothetical protein
MRFGIYALLVVPMLLLTGCTQRDPVKPNQPAVQIIIPDTPGWSPVSNNTHVYGRFDAQLRERIRLSDGVINKMTWAVKDLSTVVTLYGDHPDQILTITLPFFKSAGLPAGTTVTKYDGADGMAEQPVPIGS